MCLKAVDEKPTCRWGIGYKSVKLYADGTYWCYDHGPNAGKVSFPLNEWVTDPQDIIIDGGGDYCPDYPRYRCGFHVMLERNEDKHLFLRIIKVRFRKVTATSPQDDIYGPQVVAREVMNLGEVSPVRPSGEV